MLPICLGEATKFSQYLLDSDKRYRVIAKLGQRTDTSDADGQIVQERPVNFTQAQLDAALDTFRGDIQQVPSMYSALKYQGKKLYEYARQGIEVPREARSITVYELQFIRWEGDELELEIHCSKGTYIRTITDDLGELLGCGARDLSAPPAGGDLSDRAHGDAGTAERFAGSGAGTRDRARRAARSAADADGQPG